MNGHHYCGGAILTTRHVITAARCVPLSKGYYVLAGSSNREYGKVQQLMNVTRVEKHPHSGDGHHRNDIAIVFLEKDLVFNKMVQPILFPRKNIVVAPGSNVTIAGWGRTEESSLSYYLKFALIHTVPDEVCEEAYGKTFWKPGMLCAAPKEKASGSCSGDNGGPLAFNATRSVIGIVSWGECVSKVKPSIYTRLSYYVDWIVETISQE